MPRGSRPAASGATAQPDAGAGPAADGRLAFVRDPFRIVMFLLIVVNVSRVHQAVPLLGKFRPAMLLVVAAAVYAYLYPKSLTRMNVLAYWPMRRVALLGVLTCLSTAFGLSIGGSATFILNVFGKTILYSFLIALSIRNARDLYTLVWAYAVSAAILGYFALFVFQLSDAAAVAYNARLNNLYTYDANDVCVVLLVGLAAVLLLMQVAKGQQRLALLGIVVAIGASLARSGSRGGFIGLIAFGAAALVMLNTVSITRRAMLLLVVLAGMAAFAPSGYWEQMRTIASPKTDYNMTDPNGRKALIKRGIGYMKAYPIFGVGIDNFGRAECEISGEIIGAGGSRCGAPHNSYVQAGSETGVPGLIVWVSIVLGGMWALLKFRRRLPVHWRRGNQTERFLYNATHYFAIGLAGFAVSAFFVSFAWLDILYTLTGYITGLYVSVAVYRASAAAGGPAHPQPMVISRNVPGWRVLESARRMAAMQGTATFRRG
jgi:O-antigen ligase